MQICPIRDGFYQFQNDGLKRFLEIGDVGHLGIGAHLLLLQNDFLGFLRQNTLRRPRSAQSVHAASMNA